MKKFLQKKTTFCFIMAILFFLVPGQSVKGLICENTADNSGPSVVIIEAPLSEYLFSEEKNV